ncbi:SUMF1/EgtB/PvdO family nonheme iron enzyme [Roseovarius arcticus]|uniref:SUMF1/EgtB/PvdO family nonheme iron enzyme n=1 Tax=Roseovarius arcticus TaxID=2547404 RepID=UPI001FE928C6|nr:SUMF1/EgtB/PvdO family nonheme iron enzyme [Roseovarius arcticus]
MKRQFKFAIGAIGLAAMTGIAITGAAWITRGPGASLLPDMAGPIALADGRSVWVQHFEVTVADWNVCYDAGGCALWMVVRPDQQVATTPATGISYPDARQYVDWINDATGGAFRLPTVAEWVQIAASVMPEEPEPLFTDPSLSWASAYLIEADIPRALKPSGSFSTTAAGVADLDGSVWEWTQDCYSGTEDSAPGDRCPAFYVAGLHIAAMSFLERDPARGGCAVGVPPAHLGLRLFSDNPN